jgi:uncharacterized damage-inducible protein DinB
MPYLLDLEEMEGRWIAHAGALLGCFASAEAREAAVAGTAQAIAAYAGWRTRHGDPGFTVDTPATTAVDEVHRAWNAAPDYEVNAFFARDRAPLGDDDIRLYRQLLEWSRADLLAAAAGLAPADLQHTPPGLWPIGGILNHTARAENWYLSRLGLALDGLDALPDVFTRLERVRARLAAALPGLAGDERVAVVDGETWSPRKLLRRALWHERDHTGHILQVRAQL